MIKYAKGPVSFLYKDVKSQKTGKISRRKVKQLLWGDWVRVKGPEKPKWAKVKYGRGTYLMKLADLQDERALEIIFLDVGQGDGCILTEPGPHPDPKILIIDAGIGRNMRGFLDWRFRDFPETGNIHAAIITHPDKDHYNGFSSVFSNQKLKIEHVYHNGIVERKGADRLGPAKDGYLTDVIVDHNQAKALVTPKANRGRMPFPNLIKKAIDAAHIGEVKALTTAHAVIEGGKAWIPGFEPSAVSPISIEVLGPVVERDAIGKAVLRQFGQSVRSKSPNDGKTKNGHSVLLRLDFDGFRVLFGGDLNLPSETFLMLWYGNNKSVPPPLSGNHALLGKIASKAVIKAANDRLEVDLMKNCHHGSSDVTDEFLEATHAAAFVISSGDNEGHVHPRPDLLGLLGKKGRGNRPLLLSTELLRSTREREDPSLRTELKTVTGAIEAELLKGPLRDKALLKDLRATRKRVRDELFKRNVGVYGAVNLRTDGKTALIAFRKEAAKDTERWFFYELTRKSDGSFEPKLKGH